MDIVRTAVNDFWVGHGGADAVARPLVAKGYAPEAVYKGVCVRAMTGNTAAIYVGPVGVTVDNGYKLPAGEAVEIQVQDVSKVHVIAQPSGNSQQVVTISGDATGDTFILVGDGVMTDPIDANAASALTVQTALESVYGEGNVSVSGDSGGPYTVEYTNVLAGRDVTLMVGVGIGVNEQQTVTVTDGAECDQLILTFDGVDAPPVSYDATAADVQSSLETIPALTGNVSVSGAGPYVVTFINDCAATDMDVLTGVCGRSARQSINILGGGEAGDILVVTYDGVDATPVSYGTDPADVQAALETIPALTGNVSVSGSWPTYMVDFVAGLARTAVETFSSVCGKNEQQTISIDAGVSGGTFTLTLDSETTGDIAYDADGAVVEAALELLANVGEGQVGVTGSAGGPWVVVFTGTLARTDVAELVGDGTNLVGDIKTVTVEETVEGRAVTVSTVEIYEGHAASVDIAETQKGHVAPTVVVSKTDASAGSLYSWVAV